MNPDKIFYPMIAFFMILLWNRYSKFLNSTALQKLFGISAVLYMYLITMIAQAIANYLVLSLEQKFFNYFKCVSFVISH